MKGNLELPTITLPNNEGKILLHSCCAPCVCEIMETLKRSAINTTVFFYNPNIDNLEEYNSRKEENIRFAEKLNIPFIDGDYNHELWLNSVKGHENEPEKGGRCSLCFLMRLSATADYACENGFQLFTSSLGISRWKNFNQVCDCGIKAASKYLNLTYWNYNWRKKGGSERMDKISKRENFYRQNYYGCEFSKRSH